MLVNNHAPMKGSRFKGAWRLDDNSHADHRDLPLRQVVDEHLDGDAPDTFVSLDEPDMVAEIAEPCGCDSCILPGILPGEDYAAYYRRTEVDDDGTVDLEAHEAGWGTTFDPDDLGWGFSIVDGFSIRRRDQVYAKAF
jgi:hypothetical protein